MRECTSAVVASDFDARGSTALRVCCACATHDAAAAMLPARSASRASAQPLPLARFIFTRCQPRRFTLTLLTPPPADIIFSSAVTRLIFFTLLR